MGNKTKRVSGSGATKSAPKSEAVTVTVSKKKEAKVAPVQEIAQEPVAPKRRKAWVSGSGTMPK